MNEHTETILDTAREAAEKASDIIMGLLNRAEISDKGTNNLVTEADIKSEKAIREIILRDFPGHAILGEEGGGESNFEAKHLWVIDPLDGTNNYAHGFPFFSVSIAYAEEGDVQAGLVYDPNRKEFFTAVKGGGAFLNGKPLKVSEHKLNEALVITGFYYDRGNIMRRTLRTLQKLFESNIRGMRRTGSAALDMCYVAAARADAYIEYKLSPWDFAAAMLILREAGGDARDTTGSQLSLRSESVAVCNGVFTDEMLEIIDSTTGD